MGINPGEFQKAYVLTLRQNGTTWAWYETAAIWAKFEKLTGKNLFSAVGNGAESYKITMRKRPLSMIQAIRCGGEHYFISDIRPSGRNFVEVSAAKIEPVTAVLKRNSATVVSNVTKQTLATVCTLPVIVTEKYVGFNQTDAPAATTLTYVAITPKVVTAKVGDVMIIGNDAFAVELCHTLNAYKNEYEITRRGDA